jgi:protein SCO1/2
MATSALLVVAASRSHAADQHNIQGMLLTIDAAKHVITVSCDPIPGYMEAMVMPFAVRDTAALKGLHPGVNVRFTMTEKGHEDYAEGIQVISSTNYESEPTEAARLTLLHQIIAPKLMEKAVPIGHAVPDFTLTDQQQKSTNLAQFKGKVVALTFAYSRCPNPNYCFRLSNNLWRLSRRFHAVAGSDLVLMTIVIDPDNDRGKALDQYADTWKANPAAWHFLTGPLPEVRSVAELFGMNFWSDEGFLTHTFHTVVIDRQGHLAANLEGNQFNADQLGDLVETVLHAPASTKMASSSGGN